MALISVVVPVYKVEPYLERCVDSILSQTFSDFELILIDDGSPDKCGEICDQYAQKDSRVVVIHQENGGLSAARNAGIDWSFENSDSEWLTFIDSDDWVHSQYLEMLYDATIKTETDIVICGFSRTDKKKKYSEIEKGSVKTYYPEDFWVYDRVNATVAWGKLYKKNCFAEVRYPLGKLYEDEYITYKLLFRCEKLTVIENVLYYYYQNNEGIMTRSWTVRGLDETWAYKKQLEFFEDNKYKKAIKNSLECYVDSLLYSMVKLKNMPSEITYENRVIKELHIIMRKYKYWQGLSKKQKMCIYKIVYPNLFLVLAFIKKKWKHGVMLYKEKGLGAIWKKIIKR